MLNEMYLDFYLPNEEDMYVPNEPNTFEIENIWYVL